jgi:hypothetical protein
MIFGMAIQLLKSWQGGVVKDNLLDALRHALCIIFDMTKKYRFKMHVGA